MSQKKHNKGYIEDISSNVCCKRSDIKIAFMYDATGESMSPQRNSSLPEINNIIFSIQHTTGEIIPYYVGITQKREIDLINLNKAVEKGYTVFCSALGSTIVKYLQELFFNHQTPCSGIIHVNSFSTSTELNTSKNLVRLYPADIYTPNVFLASMGYPVQPQPPQPPLIVMYNPGNIFSESLANSIIKLARDEFITVYPISVPYDDHSSDWMPQIEALNPGFYNFLIISNFAPEYATILEQNKHRIRFDFNIFFTDANANAPMIPDATRTFLVNHKLILVQLFISLPEIAIAFEIGRIFNNPTQRLSADVAVFIRAIDVATLMNSTHPQERNNRKDFAGITLTEFGSNNLYLYGGYSITKIPGQIKLSQLIYVNEGIPSVLDFRTQQNS